MRHELINLLDIILGTHITQGQSEVYWPCPFCHTPKQKFAININKGAWHCWVCSSAGKSIISLLRKLDCTQSQILEISKLLNETVYYNAPDTSTTVLSLPEEFSPLYEPTKLISYKQAMRYVLSRGITAADILKYQIGYCLDGLYANRIVIPSYDSHNQLNYFIARSYVNDSFKYKNPKVSKNIVGFENSINWNYPIVLCEGVYDAMSIKRNAIPLLGKTIPQAVLDKIVKHNVRDIYLALDKDALSHSIKFAEYFMNENRNVYIVELDEKDPSEIGFEHMTQLIKSTEPLTFSRLIKFKVNR